MGSRPDEVGMRMSLEIDCDGMYGGRNLVKSHEVIEREEEHRVAETMKRE